MLKFDKVSKKFLPSSFALEEIDLEINDGEFVFVTGPSGAGKTTFLKLIIRDLKPTYGKIILSDLDLTKLKGSQISKLRQKVATVFQDFKLLNDRTVFENIAIALELRGLKDPEIEKKVKNVLELTELVNKTNLFPAQLAGGELQRVCLARAIVGNPQILLADEPTGNLDPATSWGIIKIISQINKLGTTVIMATHNVDIVNSLRKRVLTLNKGKIVRDEKEGKYENI